MTSAAHARVDALGGRLADGLGAAFARFGLRWRAFRCGPRSGFCLTPELPRNGAEAAVSIDGDLIDARRLFMANRGIWDAIATAGPQVSFAHDAADVDRYVEVASAFLEQIVEP